MGSSKEDGKDDSLALSECLQFGHRLVGLQLLTDAPLTCGRIHDLEYKLR